MFNALFPDFCKKRIFRMQGADEFYPASPPASVIEDKKTPAPVIATDLRPRQVYGTVCLLTSRLVPEKRACVRNFLENTFIQKNFDLVRINSHNILFVSVIVVDKERVVAPVFLNKVNHTKVMAAVPALEALKRRIVPPSYHETACQIARPNSSAIRIIITHSRKFECWIRTSSESIE